MSTRNILVAAGSALAISALATAATAATVSATANASVTVISPTTLTKVQDMAFGTVIRPTTGSNTITLGANGTVTRSGAGDGGLVASTTSAAKFTLASQAAISYSLAPSLTFTQAGLTNVTVSAPSVTGTPGHVGATSSEDILYGASFDMDVTTTPQNYTGVLTVIVTYN